MADPSWRPNTWGATQPRNFSTVTQPMTRTADPSGAANFGRSGGQDYELSQQAALMQAFMEAANTAPQPKAASAAAPTPTGALANAGQRSGTNPVVQGGQTGDGSSDPWQGFAGQYAQGTWNWDDAPAVLTQDWLQSRGMQGDTGMEGLMSPWTGLGLPLFNLLNGGAEHVGNDVGDDQVINWIADNFLNNLSTPGARTYDAGDLMGNIYDYGNDKSGDMYASLFLNSDGSAKDPNSSISSLMNYVNMAGNFTNPMHAAARKAQANRLANDYRGELATGGSDQNNILEYLRSRGFAM